MRQQLKQLGDAQRYTFRATFVRTGFKNSSSYFGNRQYDYKVERPTKTVLLMPISQPREPLPEENQALIGMIMEENKAFYLDQGRPYDPFYVDQFHEWQNKQKQLQG